jgi:dCMP deaminase
MKPNSFLDIASIFAAESHCLSFQVAALAVKNGRILYTGINGTPSKYQNCDQHFDPANFKREEHHQWSLVHEIHAEQSLVAGACRNGISLDGADVYLTVQPCSDCMKLLIACGIKKIFYRQAYDKTKPESMQLASDCGVEVIHVKEEADGN